MKFFSLLPHIFLCFIISLAIAPRSYGSVDPEHVSIVCSGFGEDGSYFTLSHHRNNTNEFFIVDVSSEVGNESGSFYVESRNLTSSALHFMLKEQFNIQLVIDLVTGVAHLEDWLGDTVDLKCASYEGEVDDVLKFIEENDLPN